MVLPHIRIEDGASNFLDWNIFFRIVYTSMKLDLDGNQFWMTELSSQHLEKKIILEEEILRQ